jgi:hypothetical protein
VKFDIPHRIFRVYGRQLGILGVDGGRSTVARSPISPLLANLYMRRFVLGWKMLGLEQSLVFITNGGST